MLGNLEFLFCEISGDIDHLHPVLESRLNVVDIVGRRDEKDIRKIVVNVKIVIMESCILFRIKDFQQCRRRISLDVAAELVNLVKHDYRI